MNWDNNQPFTPDGFAKHVQSIASQTYTDWWIRKKIHIYHEPGIPRSAIKTIITAVDERIYQVLHSRFTIKLDTNENFATQIEEATVNGHIDEHKLFSLASFGRRRDPYRGGRQHGGIYITTKPFLHSPASWGAAHFKFGTIIFALNGRRYQPTNLLRNVALHETTHLIGMYTHCKTYQNVQGYDYHGPCNMDPDCKTGYLCPKCRDLVVHFWKQVNYQYDQHCRQAA